MAAKTDESTGDKLKSSIKRYTIEYVELLDWQHDNEFIKSGYRRHNGSFAKCLSSCFHWHNEIVNIWTHFLAALLFFCIACAPLSPALQSGIQRVVGSELIPVKGAQWKDLAALYTFLFGAVFLFTASWTFHCFSCHSAKVCRICNVIDHLGIVTLICTSFVPAIWFGFYCHTTFRLCYLAMITIFGSGLAYTMVNPVFRSPEYRRLRAWLFIALGGSAILPLIHFMLLDGISEAKKAFGLNYLLLEGALYISGAILYAERFPERWFPYTFDYVPSHSIFHVAVNLAAWCHYLALREGFEYRRGKSC